MRRNFAVDFQPDISLWRGLPVGALPPTPFHSDSQILKSDFTSETVLFILAMELGMYIQAYLGEKNGAMVHNVIPIPGKEPSFSNQGSFKFPMHIEAPHLDSDLRPDYLALFCLRGGSTKAFTSWSVVQDALDLLTEEDINELSKPQFLLTVGESWSNAAGVTQLIRILNPDGVRLNLAKTRGTNSIADGTLARLSTAIETVKQVAVLEPGDLLLINNRTCVHGREEFKSVYDGNQRWLQRVYLKWPK